jgi:RHS repeat-associated protein
VPAQEITFTYDELNRIVRKYYAMDWGSGNIVAGTSKPSVYDIIELRNAINVNRVPVGLGLYNWTDPAIVAGKDVKVRAVHFADLKSAIQGLWTAAGIGTLPEFTGGAITGGTRKIKAGDLTDLRSWLSQYEGSAYAQTLRARAWYSYDEYDGVNQFGRGRRTAMFDVSGRHHYRYDLRGRLTRDEQVIDGVSYVTSFTYDAMDRVYEMTYPDLEKLTFTYDSHTKLKSLATTAGGNYLTNVAYNQLLKPKTIPRGNGATTTYDYNGNGDLDVIGVPYGSLQKIQTTKSGLPTIQDLRHTYDNVGNLTQWQDMAASEDFTFEYDDLDRLTVKKITGGSNLETFTYTRIGNIDYRGTSTPNLPYTYGDPLHVHAVTSYNGTSYAYDNNGNMITAGNWSYVYDKEDRMVRAVLSGIVQARFTYDGDGKRAKRLDVNGTIHYVGGHYERNVGNGLDTTEKVSKYYYATLGSGSKLIAFRKSGTLYYLHSDHLGSSTRTTDASGNILDTAGYKVYGETRSGGTNLQTDKRFTGQTLDQSTGLYWYASRAYNPVLGRFIQPDTVVPDFKNPQALNRYSYGLNNPLRYVDPTGHWFEDWDVGGWANEVVGDIGDAVGAVGEFVGDVAEAGYNYASETAEAAWQAAEDAWATVETTAQDMAAAAGLYDTSITMNGFGVVVNNAPWPLDEGVRALAGGRDNTVTLGPSLVISSTDISNERETLQHEGGHQLQALLMGPMYIPMYELSWGATAGAVQLVTGSANADTIHKYNPMEVQANNWGGLPWDWPYP